MPRKKSRKPSRARAREEDDSIGGMISNATRELKKIWSNPLYRVFGVMILSQILSNRLEEKSGVSDSDWEKFAAAKPGAAYTKNPHTGELTPIPTAMLVDAVAKERKGLGQNIDKPESLAEFQARAAKW